MKYAIALITICCMLFGCSSMQRSTMNKKDYYVDISVALYEEDMSTPLTTDDSETPSTANQYSVKCTFVERKGEENRAMLSPRLTVLAGKKFFALSGYPITEGGSQSRYKVSGLVTEAGEKINVSIDVYAEIEGHVVIDQSQTNVLSRADGGSIRIGPFGPGGAGYSDSADRAMNNKEK